MSSSLWPCGLRPPGSSIQGILQARRILEWVAISSSRGSSWSRDDRTRVSCTSSRLLYCLSHQRSHKKNQCTYLMWKITLLLKNAIIWQCKVATNLQFVNKKKKKWNLWGTVNEIHRNYLFKLIQLVNSRPRPPQCISCLSALSVCLRSQIACPQQWAQERASLVFAHTHSQLACERWPSFSQE